MSDPAGASRRARDPELARAAAAQKAKEAELRTELIREQRTEKKTRITKDLFEEEEEANKKKPGKGGKKRRAETEELTVERGNGADEDADGDDRPEDALKEVQGEELQEQEEEFDEKGVPIEPFNLRAEMEEGYFDKDGNYVRHRRAGDEPVRDAWLDEVDERLTSHGKSKALAKAAASNNKATPTTAAATTSNSNSKVQDKKKTDGKEEEEDEEEEDEEAEPKEVVDVNRAKRSILRMLRTDGKAGENALAALRRLKGEGRMDDFNALTEAADLCVQRGLYEIYSETKRQLLASVAADEGDEKLWQYRALGDEQAAVHGPFSSAQMREWHSAGYFQGDTVMLVRRSNSPTFRRSDALDFDRLLLPRDQAAS